MDQSNGTTTITAEVEAQINAVMGSESAAFESLIMHLMSASNEQRGQAEALFNICKEKHPDALALKLVHVLQSCGQVEIRAMAAILLRKQITRDETYIWPRLAPPTQTAIKADLLVCVQREEAKTIVKKLCDTVAELAASIMEEGQWPELLPFMFQCVSSDSPRLKESALLMFAQLSQFIGDHLHPHLSTLHTVFHQCLSPPSPSDVRIAALAATTNFVQTIETPQDRERFQDLIPAMMQTLTEALNTNQEALEMFIELAGSEPRFLRRQIVNVVGSMLQIAEAETLEEGTRHLAIEFIITLAEARERAPGMMRKFPQFIGRLFAILMKLLLDIEDDPAWHAANTEDEDAGESSNYSVGQECLERLVISLGENTIVPVASELLPAYLADPDWRKHHAALITLAQVVEGCAKVMLKNLEPMVLKSFQDPNPRVRWVAINAIVQLSTDLGPDLQQQYHQQVLPALAGAMDDFQNPRVQAHAASAVLNFSKNCTPEILTPYLDGIVSKLLVLLQNGRQMVQEGALTALASVAYSSQEHFQKYYDAVRKEKFRNDAKEEGEKSKEEHCGICLEDINVSNMHEIMTCRHRFCFPCMSQYVEAKLKDGCVPSCPHEMCNIKLTVDGGKAFLLSKWVEVWTKRLEEAAIPESDRVYCPNPNCSALMTLSGLYRSQQACSSSHPFPTAIGRLECHECHECHKYFCIECLVPWHTGMSCQEYQGCALQVQGADAKLHLLAKENRWMQCENCKHMIELAEGACNHIQCSCGLEFCYLCGAERENKRATCKCPYYGSSGYYSDFCRGSLTVSEYYTEEDEDYEYFCRKLQSLTDSEYDTEEDEDYEDESEDSSDDDE